MERNMKKKRIVGICLFVLLLAMTVMPVNAYNFFRDYSACPATPVTNHPRILMIGNSLTYTNNLPKMLAGMCADSGISATVDSVTVGGHSLTQYVFPSNDAERAISQRLMDKLKKEKWDYVIVQGRREEPVSQEASMRSAVAKLYPLIRDSGAQMVLYMTWAADFRTAGYDMDRVQGKVADVYYSLAKQYSCALAPSGIAFARERNLYPEYDLYFSPSDRIHPNLSGSYLSACCIYGTLFGRSPVQLSYTAGIPDAQVKILRALAADVTTGGSGGSGQNEVMAKAAKSDYQLQPGTVKQLSYSATHTNVRIIRCSSSNPSVAEVDQNGRVLAKAAGMATVTMRLSNNQTLGWDIVVTKYGKLTLGAGDKQKLDFSPVGYTWKSSNKKVAVAKGGVITAKAKGRATVTGEGINGTEVTVQVTVKAAPKKVTVKNVPRALAVGQQYRLKLNVSKVRVAYKSSRPKIISVTEDGVLQAKKAGTVKITVTAYNGKRVSFKVTSRVMTKKLKVTNLESGDVLRVGQKKKIRLNFAPTNVTSRKVTYKSSNKKVLTVDNKGVIKAVGRGTARVTVTAADGSKKKVIVKLTVKK